MYDIIGWIGVLGISHMGVAERWAPRALEELHQPRVDQLRPLDFSDNNITSPFGDLKFQAWVFAIIHGLVVEAPLGAPT